MTTNKPVAGGSIPALNFQTVGGETIGIGGARATWMLLIVYRGKHCPRCKTYLNRVESMKKDWEDAGFEIVAVSADPLEKAQADVDEFGWSFPVGYGLTETQMQSLGLYISEPLSAQENDRRFAEPGLFCIRPDGTMQIVAISNGPAARPELAELLSGMIFTIKNDRPARGTV